jgi:tetratricopeptide (TPR) repeat protein
MKFFPLFQRPLLLWLLVSARLGSAVTFDEQIHFWEKRIARDPEDYISPVKLGEVYLQQARESGDLTANGAAEKYARLSLQRNPAHLPALALLASACIAQHKFAEARTLAEKAVQGQAADAFTFAVLGDACLELGDVPCAERSYGQMLQLKAALATHSRLANLHWIKGHPTSALRSYEDAIQAGQSDFTAPLDLAWCYLQKGHLHFRTGEFEKADEAYAVASKILPDNYSVLEHVAELRAAQGKYDEAISSYKKVLTRAPRPEFQQALGDLYLFIGKSAEATNWHEQARSGYLKAAERGEAHYYHHLASFYSDVQEKPDEALKWARKDLEVRPSIFAYDTLAWALYRNSQWPEALDATRKALALGTKDAHLFFHAGMIFVRAGKGEEGRAYLRQALEANPRYNSFHAHR